MSSMIWQVRLEVPESDADIAADRLWCAGAQAIEEVDRGAGERGVQLRTVLADAQEESERLVGAIPATWRLEVVQVDTTPGEQWKAHVRPINLRDRSGTVTTIAPTWCEVDQPDSQIVWIDPGPAFGLGDHPTTRLTAEMLLDCDLGEARVLDVGTGSGVLAVLAAQRGARDVVGIDISAAAVSQAVLNAERNSVRVSLSTTPLAEVEGVFDVVVANILAPTLVDLAPSLISRVAPGGELVISGVLASRYQHVVDALHPGEVVEERLFDGWAAVKLKRPTASVRFDVGAAATARRL